MQKNLIFLLCLFLIACSEKAPEQKAPNPRPLNEVYVLGAIHGRHRTSARYGTNVLENLIRKLNPDYVLVEIPPDRFPIAMEEFKRTDSVSEPRVKLFPEYVDVLFPLTKEMDFEIVPTAGWTKEMALDRREKLKIISQDSLRVEDWARYLAGEKAADSMIAALGGDDDPQVIHSLEYDAAVELWARPYNEMFNEELGLGGWDNINAAHYSHIERALKAHEGEGKRFLIIYGAYHKGWFLRELRKREGIELKDLRSFFPKREEH